ncbi:hypothetical protein BV22DRAFT_421960 [Leucogyrophana mollusca]|uniref:Uncharacterized protein n=1 Tax=Leucogyrophana mollusca TaxID=85980 RepID=A0ACB8BII6_9AGAM|nr:hypothetical protein BV22DRAFT_421960 [Leucogyrophana mollusca]
MHRTRRRGVSLDAGITDVVMPCHQCSHVIRFKRFRNALRRPKIKENANFTPKSFRNEILEEASQRHMDVQELMEMVCLSCFMLPTSIHWTHMNYKDGGKSRWLTLAKKGAKGRDYLRGPMSGRPEFRPRPTMLGEKSRKPSPGVLLWHVDDRVRASVKRICRL